MKRSTSWAPVLVLEIATKPEMMQIHISTSWLGRKSTRIESDNYRVLLMDAKMHHLASPRTFDYSCWQSYPRREVLTRGALDPVLFYQRRIQQPYWPNALYVIIQPIDRMNEWKDLQLLASDIHTVYSAAFLWLEDGSLLSFFFVLRSKLRTSCILSGYICLYCTPLLQDTRDYWSTQTCFCWWRSREDSLCDVQISKRSLFPLQKCRVQTHRW